MGKSWLTGVQCPGHSQVVLCRVLQIQAMIFFNPDLSAGVLLRLRNPF